jgi:hypothetical protein
MKNISRIAFIIIIMGVLAVGTALTASAAPPTSALYQTTPTPAPDLDWHCNSADPGICPEDGSSPWGYSGEDSGTTEGWWDMLDGKILCSGWGCTATDVYVQIDWEVTWSSAFTRYVSVSVASRANAAPLNWHEVVTDCGTGLSGSCGGHYYEMLEADEMPDDPALAWHVRSNLTISGVGTNDPRSMNFTVNYSGQPIDIDTCDSQYQRLECETTELDPTNETGVSSTLTVGKTYRIEVKDGPWNDGTSDRYDVAISTDDGATWTSLSQFSQLDNVECIQNDPDNPEAPPIVFFTANTSKFRVRVNDVAGQFGNNTGSISAGICKASMNNSGCQGQFQYDDESPVAVFNIPANDPQVDLPLSLVVGNWYALETSGEWRDGGVGGPASSEMEVLGPEGWVLLDNWSQANCVTLIVDPETGEILEPGQMVYFQAFNETLSFRVHDEGGVWEDNYGSMIVAFFDAAFDRFETSCETTFEMSNLVKDGTVGGSASAGLEILNKDEYSNLPIGGNSSPQDRWFAIDTTAGPWLNGSTSSYAADIKNPDNPWGGFDEWPYCSVPTDEIGHWRIYVPAYGEELNSEMWYFYRVSDPGGNYNDNSGNLGYSIFNTYLQGHNDPGTPPVPNTCDDADFTHGSEFEEASFEATSSAGVSIPNLTMDEMYAVETTGGPWSNNGSSSYDVDISDDDGDTWYQIWAHPAILCSQALDTEHVLVYFNMRAGHVWKMRVRDTGEDYTDNSGSMGLKAYLAGTPEDPWASCSDDYNLSVMTIAPPANEIYAIEENGTGVPFLGSLLSTSTIAIEITTQSTWSDADGNASYLAQITYDGGATWTDWEEAAGPTLCVVTVDPETSRKRIYFSNPGEDGNIRLRVSYDGSTWETNTGKLIFDMYKASSNVDPGNPDDPDNPYPPSPPPVTDICAAYCFRPSGLFSYVTIRLPLIIADAGNAMVNGIRKILVFLGLADEQPLASMTTAFSFPVPDVGNWLEYAKCAATHYIAWCPLHMNLISRFAGYMREVEPVATTLDIVDLINYIWTQFQSFDWAGSAGGGGEAPIYAESIIGGIIEDTQGEGGGDPATIQNAVQSLTEQILPQPTGIWAGDPFTLTLTPNPAGITQCAFRNIFQVSDMLGDTICFLQNITISKTGLVLLILFDILILFEFFTEWLPRAIKKFRRALSPFENAVIDV